MVLDEHKAIFFHVPKTGGTSVEEAFCPRYVTTHDYRKFEPVRVWGDIGWAVATHFDYNAIKAFVHPDKLKNYKKFAFFRNTWDRMYSAYTYLKSIYDAQFGEGFENYVRHAHHTVMTKTYAPTAHIKPQIEYVLDDKGRVILDFMGEYEHMNADFAELCDFLDIPRIPLPHMNKSDKPHKHYREAYTDTTKALIAEAYKDEIDFFNYSF